MKQLISWFSVVYVSMVLPAQVKAQDSTVLTLEKAYQLAREHYPLIKQRLLVSRNTALALQNISKSWLPQASLSGQATYQSDVPGIPVKIPGFDIEQPSKDQYRITAEVNQLLYDGGSAAAQKNVQQASSKVELQRAEVDLYKVKERINQLYLGILLLDEQLKQTELVKKDIQRGIKRVEAQVQYGTAFRSNLLTLQAELLSVYVNQPLRETVQLQKPVWDQPVSAAINRPELALFQYQDSLLHVQKQLINARNRPRTSLFVQGGYGRPGLNMLKNEFEFFYIGGLRLNWSLGNLYTARKEKEMLAINQQMLGVQKDVFLLNTNAQLSQQQAEIQKLEALIATDREIIAVRQQVKEAAHAQLQNGVITASDYLSEVNAEDQARLTLIAHELQLLQARIDYQTIAGNQ
jgi:outer membrane protein TolC